MKLTTISAITLALATPAAIQAQDESGTEVQRRVGTAGGDMNLSFYLDDTGIDIRVDNPHVNGTIAILVSTEIGSQQLPEAFGGGELGIGSPMWLLAFEPSADDYHLPLALDIKALAALGIKVYVQAVSFNNSDWEDRPVEFGEEGAVPARISEVMTVDFKAEEEAEPMTLDVPKGAKDDSQDPDNDPDPSQCRCPAEENSEADDSADDSDDSDL